MGTSKYFVWGEGVWRELDSSSGRVTGWRRRARFVFVRRGRLHVARRRAVLRALQALAAGLPGAAADGPRLSYRRKSETRLKALAAALPPPAPPPPPPAPPACLHHHCCAHYNGNIPGHTVAPVLAQRSFPPAPVPAAVPGGQRLEAATQCVPAHYTINLHAHARLRHHSSDDFQAPDRKLAEPNSRTEVDKLLGKQQPEKISVEKAKPAKTINETNIEELLDKHESIETHEKRDSSSEWDKQSSASMCKELIVSEGDVRALRGFVARSRPDALRRFDADEGYRRALFYAINPLVELRRCARLERALSERQPSALPGFAARLGLAPRSAGRDPSGSSDTDKENKEESSGKRAQRRHKPNIPEHSAARPRTKPNLPKRSADRLRTKPKTDERPLAKFNNADAKAERLQNKLKDADNNQRPRNTPHVDKNSAKKTDNKSENEKNKSVANERAKLKPQTDANKSGRADTRWKDTDDAHERPKSKPRSDDSPEKWVVRSGRTSSDIGIILSKVKEDTTNRPHTTSKTRNKHDRDRDKSSSDDDTFESHRSKSKTEKNKAERLRNQSKVAEQSPERQRTKSKPTKDKPERHRSESSDEDTSDNRQTQSKPKINGRHRTQWKAKENSPERTRTKSKSTKDKLERDSSESETDDTPENRLSQLKSNANGLRRHRIQSKVNGQTQDRPHTRSKIERKPDRNRDKSSSDEDAPEGHRNQSKVDELSAEKQRTKSKDMEGAPDRTHTKSRTKDEPERDSSESETDDDIPKRHHTKSKTVERKPDRNRKKLNVNGIKAESRTTRANGGTTVTAFEPVRRTRAGDDVTQPSTSRATSAVEPKASTSKAVNAARAMERDDSTESDSDGSAADSERGAPAAKRARVEAPPAANHSGPVHSISKRASAASAKEYSNLEDHAIVAWVSGGARASLVNGNRVWRDLQDQYQALTGTKRSWHSLRNRYLRYILPALGALMLPHDEQARLRAAARTGCLKKKRSVAARRNSMFAEVSRFGASSRRRPPPAGPARDAGAAGDAGFAGETHADADNEAPAVARSLRPRTPGSAAAPRSARSPRLARSPRYSSLTRRFAARHRSDTSSPHPSPAASPPASRSTVKAGSRKLYNPN